MFEAIISELGCTLAIHSIPYMVIGGQAVLLYGEPRLTRDIDVTLGVDTDRFDDLVLIAQELSLKILPDDAKKFAQETMVLPCMHEETGIRVDFIFSFTPYELQAISRAAKVAVAGKEICFASVEDLVIHKIFAGRPRDLEDVRSILLRNPDIDDSYIRTWLDEFDKAMQDAGFGKTFDDILSGLE